ncbi:putative RNA-directed DNA polymerase [Tanacetum coccineum]
MVETKEIDPRTGKPRKNKGQASNSEELKYDSLVDLPQCTCDTVEKIKKHSHLIRLMQFLMGLDDVYSSVWSNILITDLTPDVKSAFSTLSRDESHRLRHPADQVLCVLKYKIDLSDMSAAPGEVCLKAKQIIEPFSLSDHKTTDLGQIVHINVLGPYRVKSREGYKYFLTIVDDFSRDVWVSMLKGKDEVFSNIEIFFNLIKNRFGKIVKIFGSANGTKFVNIQFNNFCELGLLCSRGIPLNMWNKCVLTDVYLINMLPSVVLSGRSPYELVYKFEPSFPHLMSFGCLYFAYVLNNYDKFSARDSTSKDDDTIPRPEGKTWSIDKFATTDGSANQNAEPTIVPVVVEDSRNQGHNQDTNITADDDLDQDAATSDDENYDSEGEEYVNFDQLFGSNDLDPKSLVDEDTVRRSNRRCKLPSRLQDYKLGGKVKYCLNRYITYANLNYENYSFMCNLNKDIEPKTCKEASTDSRWIDAMNQEIKALNRNNTWKFFDLSKGRKPIGCKSIYKINYTSNGEIERFKARLVAKVHVDDIISTRNNIDEINKFKNLLSSKFLIKDLVHKLSQAMHGPLHCDFKLACRFLRYLKGAHGKGVFYKKSDYFELSAYVDSDWAKYTTTRRFVTGFAVFLVDMFCDSSATMQIVVNPVFHERTKHFKIDLYFLAEKIADGVFKICNIESEFNTTDVFIKGLSSAYYKRMFDLLKFRSMEGLYAKRHAFWSLNEEILRYCSDNLYAVSIKEDTAYLSLHFTRNHEELKSNTPYPEDSIRLDYYFEDIDYFKYFENEFLAIIYKDALASETGVSSEPTVRAHHVKKVDFDFVILFNESDDEDYTFTYDKNLFSYKLVYVNDLKSDSDNDNDEIDIKQSSGDISIEPLPDVISIDTQGSNNLLETSHDTIGKFFTANTFIMELCINIMT